MLLIVIGNRISKGSMLYTYRSPKLLKHTDPKLHTLLPTLVYLVNQTVYVFAYNGNAPVNEYFFWNVYKSRHASPNIVMMMTELPSSYSTFATSKKSLILAYKLSDVHAYLDLTWLSTWI